MRDHGLSLTMQQEKTIRRSNRLGNHAIALAVSMTACLMVSGCGNGLSQVSGIVTMDGQPLNAGDDVHATIFFQPASGGPSAAGVLNADGEYSLSSGSQKGVAPGEYLVTVSATKLIPTQNPGETPTGKLISHPKYVSAKTSGLRFQVTEGRNEINVPIESAPKK